MLETIIQKIFGNKHDKEFKRLSPVVDEINTIYETLHDLTDENLRAKTENFKALILARVAEIQENLQKLRARLKSAEDENLDHDNIRQQIEKLEKEEHEQIQEALWELLPEAFAVVKETCRRLLGQTWKVVGNDVIWDMIPFDVQLLGGIVLHEGKIAEMATGEGKTLVASLPVYLNALVGKGVHLVTVNNYLAKRDAEWMGRIFTFHGLTVGVIDDTEPNSPERRAAYRCDITYGTNNEFGFDYLRDNMTTFAEGLVQRPHHYAIIDEVDSVLVDEARTPLIISGPVGESKNRFAEMKPRVEQLVRNQNMLVNSLVAEGEKLIEENEYEAGIKLLQAHRGGPKNNRLAKIYREPGTQKLIRRVEGDYMRDKRLNELDEDLFYAIDEKAHTIDLTDKGREALAPNNPAMFILPDLATELSAIEGAEGMADSAKDRRKEELQSDYAEKSERLHNISQLLKAYSLFEKDVEYVVSDDGKVMIVDEFTGRLMPGRRFSDGLHQALEAKENVKIERETQTFATITLQNYFRLYSKLAGMTGTAETEASELWEIYKLDVVVIPTNEPIRRFDLEDVVYRTKREKYNAIIDRIQEINEAKYPVLVGTITVDVSETLSRMLKRRGIRHSVLNAKYHEQEAEIVTRAGEPGMVTIATNMAGRGTDIKLGAGVIRVEDEQLEELMQEAANHAAKGFQVFIHEVPNLEIDRFIKAASQAGTAGKAIDTEEEKRSLLAGEKQLPEGHVAIIPRKINAPTDARTPGDRILHIKTRDFATGGLHILGTERHEARRIDRQLRGRAGRQGDPGSSQFYLSLEDDLMRLFGSDRIAGVMDRMGLEEGEVITHSMITNSISRAQKRVEMRNFDIRKHLLEYDDVMTKQREVIYSRRKRALVGENLHDEIREMIEDYVYDLVESAQIDDDFGSGPDIDRMREDFLKTMLLPLPVSENDPEALKPEVLTETLTEAALEAYSRKRNALGSDLMGQLERFATLKTIDDRWKEHLYEMDRLREGIGLRAYGQKDPLLEYKQEGFRTFSEMLTRVNQEIIEIAFKAQIQVEGRDPLRPRPHAPVEMATVHEDSTGMGFAESGQGAPEQSQMPGPRKQKPVKVEHKVGRNDPCPCGSGKKYKHCHARQQGD